MELHPSPTAQKASTSLPACHVCRSVYRQPKLLPCLHSFCRTCLVSSLTSAAEGVILTCPICSHVVPIPASGLAGVPDNSFLSRMCQEYLTEVKQHLVSRSLHDSVAVSSQVSFKTSNQVAEAAMRHDQPLPPPTDTTSMSLSVGGETTPSQSTTGALEATQNVSRLQAKIMSLQGQALRVTYAIDQVNENLTDWQLHKEEVKQAIQRRSSQLQYLIKRVEHQLTTRIDSKQTDDQFYAETNRSKTELRKNLNNILHEVGVLKNIQEHGRDEEINALSSTLLGQSVNMFNVGLKKFYFNLVLPSQNIEDKIAASFGEIKLSSEESNIFTPEIQDFTNLPVASLNEAPTEESFSSWTQVNETPIQEEKELDSTAISRSSRSRVSDRKSRRHVTDLGLDKQDVREFLAQFQTARENLRSKRLEILERGNLGREDSPAPSQVLNIRPRSITRNGRVQSLDRVGLHDPRRRSSVHAGNTEASTESAESVTPISAVTTNNSQEVAIQAALKSLTPELISEHSKTPSRHGALPRSATSRRNLLVKQSSDPRHSGDRGEQHSEKHSRPGLSPLGKPPSAPDHHERGRRFSNPGASASLILQPDESSPLSPGENSLPDLLRHDRITTRPVRRAISAAADRRAKIEFLRENWQKRKEILIQNEGFLCPDSGTKPGLTKPQITDSVDGQMSKGDHVTHHVDGHMSKKDQALEHEPPRLQSVDPTRESLDQIKNRVAQYRHELTRLGDRQVDPSHRESSDSDSGQSGVHDNRYTTGNTKQGNGVVMETGRKQESSLTTPTASLHEIADKRFGAAIPTTVTTLTINETEPSITTRTSRFGAAIPTTVTTLSINETEPSITTRTSRFETTPATYYRSSTAVVSTTSEPTTTSRESLQFSSTASTPIPSTTASTPIPSTTASTTIPSTTASTTIPSTTASTPIPSTTAPITSRYSRYQAMRMETVDVAALITAMYRGNEKSILLSSKSTPDNSNKDTQPVTSNENTTSTVSSEPHIDTTTSTPRTETATITASIAPSSTPQVSRAESLHDVNVAETTATLPQPTYSTNSAQSSTFTKAFDTPYKNSVEIKSLTSSTSTETSNVSTESTPKDVSPRGSQAEPVSDTTDTAGETLRSQDSGETLTPVQTTPSRRSRASMRSRFTDGVNRRHTIEIGKAEIASALQMIARDETPFTQKSTLQPITESPAVPDSPLAHSYLHRPTAVTESTPVHSYPHRPTAVTDSAPVKSYPHRPTDVTDSPPAHSYPHIPTTSFLSHPHKPDYPWLPLDSTDLLDADNIQDTTVSFKIGASGVTKTIIPSPLEVIQEKPVFEFDSAPEPQSKPPSSPISPTHRPQSPAEMAQKLKIREIARKKKERWRHMTIH